MPPTPVVSAHFHCNRIGLANLLHMQLIWFSHAANPGGFRVNYQNVPTSSARNISHERIAVSWWAKNSVSRIRGTLFSLRYQKPPLQKKGKT